MQSKLLIKHINITKSIYIYICCIKIKCKPNTISATWGKFKTAQKISYTLHLKLKNNLIFI